LRRSAPAAAPSSGGDLEFEDPEADDEEESLDDELDDDDEVISAGGAIEEEEEDDGTTDGVATATFMKPADSTSLSGLLNPRRPPTGNPYGRDGFGARPKFRSLIVEWDALPAGYALFFPVYSTWEGRSALFLEDLYVRSEFRGKGIGKAVLAHLAMIARAEGCFGMKWEVLEWNQPAIEFYHSIGAELNADRRVLLFKDAAFERMAEDGAPRAERA